MSTIEDIKKKFIMIYEITIKNGIIQLTNDYSMKLNTKVEL